MNKLSNFIKQRRRLLLWIGGLLGLYALLGFLLVPWLAERQLVNTLQQRLDANTQVETIRFNPFNFKTSLEGLDIQAHDGSPLLSLDRLYLNLDPMRVFLLKLRIAEITLDSLELHYRRYSETDDTVTRLAQQWEASAEPETDVDEAPDDENLFPLEIGRIQYIDGSIHYRDDVPASGFETTFGPINIDIANFSTLDNDEQAIKNLVMQIEQDATLTWSSTFDISPLHLTGHLALENFSLTTPYRYLSDSLPVVINDGRLAVEFDYLFNLNDIGPQLEISNLHVQLSALEILEQNSENSFLSGGPIALEGGNFVYPDMRVEAAALRVDGLTVNLQRDAQGVMNMQTLLASADSDDATADTPDATSTDSSLQLAIAEIALADMAINFSDQSLANPLLIALQLQAGLQNFSLEPDAELPFELAIAVESGGSVSSAGMLQLFPTTDLAAKLDVSDLSLRPLQAYLDQFAQVTLDTGAVSLAATVQSNSDEEFAYQGNFALNDLLFTDRQRNETLLGLDAVRADNMDFSLSDQRLDISELTVDALYSRVVIHENGVSNIGQAMTPAVAVSDQTTEASQTSPDSAADEAAAPMAISLGRMRINDASSDFTDRNLPIVFETKIVSLDGEVSGFSSSSSEPMTVDLEGQVDEYALVEISGALNPLDVTQQTRMELVFNNLELPAMSPYVIKFAGREVAEGNLDVTLAYTIENSELQASNSVIIRNMQLGDRVEYPDAMDLPLDLAVALLKNSEGTIDLDIPVTGNVDDPQFSFGPVIRQAVSNVLTGLVTSPFRLLGNLIGGDPEQIDSIRFRPGRSDLAPPEQEKLQQLLDALTQRPQLALVIPAPFDSDADTLALQSSALDARIDEQLSADGSEAQLPERRQAVLEALYSDAMLTPSLDELRLQFTEASNPQAEEAETAPAFDALAYSAALREKLRDAETVSEQMLQDLARARQSAVADYLQAEGQLPPERVENADVATATVEDGWLSAEFDVGVLD